jgi:hypothetical protein
MLGLFAIHFLDSPSTVHRPSSILRSAVRRPRSHSLIRSPFVDGLLPYVPENPPYDCLPSLVYSAVRRPPSAVSIR